MSTYKLSIDYIMIVGKYLKSENDYINIIRVCKKYNELLLMYKYNPISNCDLFPNIETQHFYNYSDIFYRKRNMYRYVYWLQPFILNDYFKLIDTSLCVVKNISMSKFINYCKTMDFKIKNIYFNEIEKNINKINNGYLIFNYANNFFGVVIRNNIMNYPRTFNNNYFIGKKIYGNCDFFVSFIDNKNCICVRDTQMNEIIKIRVVKKQLKISNCYQDYPIVETNDKDFMINFPSFMNITDFCIIEN